MNNKPVLAKTLGLIISGLISLPIFASDNSYDIRISPAPLMLGITDIEVNIKLQDNITVAPMYTNWGSSALDKLADEGDSISLSNYGARLYWHPSGAFEDGMYISPFYKLWNLSLTTNNSFGNSASGSLNAHQFGATLGYLWQWDNFNTNIGIGYSKLSLGDVEVKDNLGNETTESSGGDSISGVAFDLSMGFAF